MAGEWSQVSLGEVITLQRGFDLPAQDRKPGKVPIVSSSGITDYHSEVGVPGPGVVTGRYGTIGQVFLIKEDFWPLNTTLWVKDFHGNDPIFTSYLLRTIDFRSCSDKSSVPGVNRNDLHQIPVLLPPLREQRAIAGVLGALDDKIELNRRTSRMLEKLARAIFRAWFVDFEPVKAKAAGARSFPGMPQEAFDALPACLVPSELGPIPEGWKVKNLSQLTEKITKGTTPTQDDISTAPTSDVRINYLRVNAIADDGSILYSKLMKIPETIHKGVLKRSILQRNDVVYTIAGTIGRMAVIDDDLLPANVNQAIAIVRPNPEIAPSRFLSLMMSQQAFQEDLHSNIVHAVQANLSLGMIAKARVVFPPDILLGRHFKQIEYLLQKAISNRRESRNLSALRDYLLPKLLSGEVRVADAEKIARSTK